MAETGNQRYFDAQIRHQVGVRRFASGEVKEIMLLLEAADRELVEKLRIRLSLLRGSTDTTTERYRALIQDIRAARRESLLELRRRFRPDLVEFAKMEVDFEQRLISASVPFEVQFATVNVQQLRAAVVSKPFQGRLLREWFNTLAVGDQRRLEQAIRLGVAQGESIPQIMARVAGTRAEQFRDGALSITRRRAEAVVRTSVNHISNAARGMVWDENQDIISALRWSATLDGRTSAICRGRDGLFTTVGSNPLPKNLLPFSPPGARPPAHVNCVLADSYVTPCGGVSAATKRFYEGQVVTIRILSDHEMTCTPNHPILTDRGWVAAQELQEGSRVVRYLGSQDPFSSVKDEDDKGPSTIEEISHPFLEGDGVEYISTSRRDFHGDGIEGEVCIVGTNGLLKFVKYEPSFLEHAGEQRFETGSRIHIPFSTLSTSTALLERSASSSTRLVSGRDLVKALFERTSIPNIFGSVTASRSFLGVGPGSLASLGCVANLNAAFFEDAVQDNSGEFAVLAEIIDALSGQVALDEVVYVGRRNFSGHVYNLQTGTGVYCAESIITHNCRSVMVAVLDGVGLLGTRPFVRDIRRPGQREVDLRQVARSEGKPIQRVREEWAEANVGQVPASTSYGQWLRRQPAGFQDEVLGQTKGKLFRQGKIELNRFVDRRGNELTLEKLRETQPEAFEAAGV